MTFAIVVEPASASKDHQLREFIVVPSERYPATLEPVPSVTAPEPLPAPAHSPDGSRKQPFVN